MIASAEFLIATTLEMLARLNSEGRLSEEDAREAAFRFWTHRCVAEESFDSSDLQCDDALLSLGLAVRCPHDSDHVIYLRRGAVGEDDWDVEWHDWLYNGCHVSQEGLMHELEAAGIERLVAGDEA